MKIQEMRMILEIIESGSISSAAKKLYIAQPSLSQCVKKIEQELGAPLFIRQSGKVLAPTETGQAYAQAAREILAIYNRFLEKLEPQHSSSKKTLRIGIPSRQGTMIMEALLQNQALSSIMDPIFQEGASSDLERLLLNGQLDLAIIRLPLKIQNLSHRIVYREPLGIWLRCGSPWAHKGVLHPSSVYPTLPLEALKNEPLILPPSDKRIRITIDHILSEKNITPKILATYQNQDSVILMVQKGICSTIGKQPASSITSQNFFWIENCRQFYDLAVVYPPNTVFKSELRAIEQTLSSHFNAPKKPPFL